MLFDTAEWGFLRQLEGHGGPVNGIAFTPKGETIATACADKKVRLYDTVSAKLLKTLEGHSAAVTAVAISPDGKLLVTGADEPCALVWDATAR